MTYRYFPDRTLVMVWLEMVNWKQRIENSGLEMTGWKQRAKKDRGRFCSSSGEETQDRLLSLFRCFFYRCFFFTLSFFACSFDSIQFIFSSGRSPRR